MSSTTNLTSDRRRIIAFDVLRVVAAFAVVLLHASAQYWRSSFPSMEWEVRTVYDALTRWCVPVFVMISGALFLNEAKPISWGKLYRKNVFRIVCAYLFWAVVYSVVCETCDYLDGGHAFDPQLMLRNIVEGPIHFWFLKMLLCLYVFIPVLRRFVARKRFEVAYLVLSLLVAFVFPFSLRMMGHSTDFLVWVNSRYASFGLCEVMGYSGYFVLGHYLYFYPMGRRARRFTYLLALMSVVCVIVATRMCSYQKGMAYDYFFDYLNPFTLIEAISVFAFFVTLYRQKCSAHQLIIEMSKASFGIYLVHLLVMRILSCFSFHSSSFSALFFIPIYTVIVFALSYLIVKMMWRIPLLRRFVS